jgi:hypothetical protein
MARHPEHRYATMEELIFAVRPFAGPPDTSTVRTIGAPPKPVPAPVSVIDRDREATPNHVELQHDAASFAEAQALLVGRRRRKLWSGGLGLAAAALAIAGAHWIERSGDTVSASSPAAHTVHLGTQQPLATAPGGESLPAQEHEAGWDRPQPPEVLTGRAAPDFTPTSAAHGKRSRRGASQHDKATAREAELTVTKRTEPSRARQQGQQDPAASAAKVVDELAIDSSASAPKPAVAPNHNTPDRVQIRRADFGATPAAPNDPLPKASVSRSDF